jgi:gamma-glutamylcyclotransferase (GGCT)/AIG2-like uncharacterized protein YtfP
MLKLFAYGLLKSGHAFFEEQLKPHIVSTTEAAVQGEIYYLPNHGFPAMMEGSGTVYGELLVFKDDSILAEIDAYEDYFPADPERSAYIRKEIEVTTKDGKKEKAFAYLMTREKIIRAGGWKIESGRYK